MPGWQSSTASVPVRAAGGTGVLTVDAATALAKSLAGAIMAKLSGTFLRARLPDGLQSWQPQGRPGDIAEACGHNDASGARDGGEVTRLVACVCAGSEGQSAVVLHTIGCGAWQGDECERVQTSLAYLPRCNGACWMLRHILTVVLQTQQSHPDIKPRAKRHMRTHTAAGMMCMQ
jgi:hypothetical protein